MAIAGAEAPPVASKAESVSPAEGEGDPAHELIQEFESALGGMRTIVYHAERAPMGRWDVQPLYRLLRELGPVDEAAVIIQSSGGSADTAHVLLSLLREYISRLHIYVPTYAASAATIFALGGDKLWMGPSSELSPIDPQVPVDPAVIIPGADPLAGMGGEHTEPLYIPAHVIRDFLEFTGVLEPPPSRPRVDRPRVDAARLETLLKPLNPWVLGWYERADNNARIYARAALRHLLAERDDAEQLAERIIYELLEGFASHDAGILRGEAKRIGIPVEDCPEDVWEILERISAFYDSVLRDQNVGRVLETTDGFHVLPANPRRTCSSCGEATEAERDFVYCPACGKPFSETCSNCDRSLRAGWKFCPRCGVAVPKEADGSTVQSRRAAV